MSTEESTPAARPAKRRHDGPRRRRKVCFFCKNKMDHIDFKQVELLRKFMTDRGKIVPHRISGNCAKHQRELAMAIKRARHIALISYVVD